MNPLNFLELKQNLGILLDRNSSNARTWLGDQINEAIADLCTIGRFDSLRRQTYINLHAPYQTVVTAETYVDYGTVAVASQGTTVTGTGTSFDENMVNQKLMLNGQAYTISAVASATSLTIDRPYEGDTAITSESALIYYDTYGLPWGCDYSGIIAIKDPKNGVMIASLNQDKFDSMFPDPSTAGNPTYYRTIGYKEDRYPASGTTALQAGTSTTSAVIAGGAGVNNYYNNWFIVNTTRTKVSRVTNFVTATQTLTVSPAITGQVVTDTVYLYMRKPYIGIYPMPSAAQTLGVSYYKVPDKLVNDYDVPFDIPEKYHRAIYLRAACHSNLILDDTRKLECEKDYAAILTKIANEYNYFAGQKFRKEGVDADNKDAYFNPYTYPLGS